MATACLALHPVHLKGKKKKIWLLGKKKEKEKHENLWVVSLGLEHGPPATNDGKHQYQQEHKERNTAPWIMHRNRKPFCLHCWDIFFFFKGYECIKILIATSLTGLKGLMKYKAGLALKRKIVFPLFSTINVCGEKRERERKDRVNHFHKTSHNMSANCTLSSLWASHCSVHYSPRKAHVHMWSVCRK